MAHSAVCAAFSAAMDSHSPIRWSRICATSSLDATNACVAPPAARRTRVSVKSMSSSAGTARENSPDATASAPLMSSAV